MNGESGLRNPAAAVRGVGAGGLVLEAIVLLLAIQPLRLLGGAFGAFAIGVVVAIAVLLIACAALLRREWAWYAAWLLQLALVGAGLLHWSLAVLGAVYALVWGYLLYVRRRILG
jgi:hypothetical protein